MWDTVGSTGVAPGSNVCGTLWAVLVWPQEVMYVGHCGQYWCGPRN